MTKEKDVGKSAAASSVGKEIYNLTESSTKRPTKSPQNPLEKY